MIKATLIFLMMFVSVCDAQIPGIVASSNRNKLVGPNKSEVIVNEFVTATGISGTNQSAVTSLVNMLIDSSLWDKMQVIYPFVGGNATAHSYNLVDTGTFKISYTGNTGNISHNSNGVNKSATTGKLETGWNPSLQVGEELSRSSIGIYSRTNSNNTQSDIGAVQTTGGKTYYFQIYPRLSGKFYAQLGADNINQNMTVDESTGWFFSSRNESSQYLQHNLTQSSTFTVNPANTGLPNYQVFITAQNNNGNESNGSVRTLAFVVITNQYISPAEGLTLYRIIQNFQTLLSRQI